MFACPSLFLTSVARSLYVGFSPQLPDSFLGREQDQQGKVCCPQALGVESAATYKLARAVCRCQDEPMSRCSC